MRNGPLLISFATGREQCTVPEGFLGRRIRNEGFPISFLESSLAWRISDQHRWPVARIAGFSSVSPDSHRTTWIDEDFFRGRMSNLRFPTKAGRTCRDFKESRASRGEREGREESDQCSIPNSHPRRAYAASASDKN